MHSVVLMVSCSCRLSSWAPFSSCSRVRPSAARWPSAWRMPWHPTQQQVRTASVCDTAVPYMQASLAWNRQALMRLLCLQASPAVT